MPTEKFIVKSYQLWSSGTDTGITRQINLVSESVHETIFFDVTLISMPKNPWNGRIGIVTNFGAANFDPIPIVAWVDPNLFDSFYAVLSGESPVSFSFEYMIDPAKPNSTSNKLRSVSLKTGVEEPGDFEKTGVSSKLTNFFPVSMLPV